MKPYGLRRGDEPNWWYDWVPRLLLSHAQWKKMTRQLGGREMKKRARAAWRRMLRREP